MNGCLARTMVRSTQTGRKVPKHRATWQGKCHEERRQTAIGMCVPIVGWPTFSHGRRRRGEPDPERCHLSVRKVLSRGRRRAEGARVAGRLELAPRSVISLLRGRTRRGRSYLLSDFATAFRLSMTCSRLRSDPTSAAADPVTETARAYTRGGHQPTLEICPHFWPVPSGDVRVFPRQCSRPRG